MRTAWLPGILARLSVAGLCLAAVSPALAQEISVIPRPVQLIRKEGAFTLNSRTVIAADEELLPLGRLLAVWLAPATGFQLSVRRAGPAAENAILLERDAGLSHLGEEGYRLEVSPRFIRICAPRPAGVFYGLQTLRQLLPPAIFSSVPQPGVSWEVPSIEVEDWPRFRWRGAMLDTSRHFMPKWFVLKFIDLLALHKLNVFHWHLTDDQGWRIEIRRYPRLTSVGSVRRQTRLGHERDARGFDKLPHGGFYSQDDIREIVEFARRRFVTIVPEIEMPGHAQAAIAAYPELGNTGQPLEVWTQWGVNKNILNPRESTIQFFQNVLKEVLNLFPGSFIHIGGDEAVKDQWKESPLTQARIRELGLTNEEELQSYFIRRMDAFLTERGRRLIGWDEILEGGLAPGATVMSWRGTKGGIAAAKAGHDIVMAPTSHTYFDYYQAKDNGEPLAIGGFIPLEKVYEFEPVPPELTPEESKHILGAQCQIWTEYIQSPGHVEYMAFPRVLALAEVVWSPAQARHLPDFLARVASHQSRLAALDVNFRPLPR